MAQMITCVCDRRGCKSTASKDAAEKHWYVLFEMGLTPGLQFAVAGDFNAELPIGATNRREFCGQGCLAKVIDEYTTHVEAAA